MRFLTSGNLTDSPVSFVSSLHTSIFQDLVSENRKVEGIREHMIYSPSVKPNIYILSKVKRWPSHQKVRGRWESCGGEKVLVACHSVVVEYHQIMTITAMNLKSIGGCWGGCGGGALSPDSRLQSTAA